jgi:hypothetical protein
LRRDGDPGWFTTVPVSAWLLLAAFSFSRQVERGAVRALQSLRVGAAGLMVLLALVAPEILARRDSGRALFAAAGGRDVLAYGAWRTAWMSGYFYNDGHVREVESLVDVLETVSRNGEALVLCGPSEARELQRARGLKAEERARGPRGNLLLHVAAEGN